MMNGYKCKLFAIHLWLLLWWIICILFTFGIGFLWLIPYAQSVHGHFYQTLKENYEQKKQI